MKEVSASAYAAAGVDLNAAAEVKLRIASIAQSTYARGVVSAPGGFGGVFDADDRSEYLMVSSTDSVGTKLRIAQAMQKHDTIGVDIVNHCVNDILPAGAEPMFFLDYIGISGYDPVLIAEIVSGVAAGCIANDCALIGGETASLPGIYHGDDYDLVGFIVGRVGVMRCWNRTRRLLATCCWLCRQADSIPTGTRLCVRSSILTTIRARCATFCQKMVEPSARHC